MIQPGKTWLVLYLICLSPIFVAAQQFRYTAELQQVDTTGFYSIDIGPQLSALLRTDCTDIRIADEKNHWVPHLLQSSKTLLEQNLFTAFPILQNMVNDSGKNVLIIENTRTAGINNLKLFIKNMAVSRTAVLSGSDNQHDWYIIDDQVMISRSYETIKDEYLQEVNFPLVRYRYLKIIVDNMHNDPLLITRAGFYALQPQQKPANHQDNPVPVIEQRDEKNYSIIKVIQEARYPFDKIVLVINGPKYFNREMDICLPATGKDGMEMPGNVIGNFKLLSAATAAFELPRVKTKTFFIVIKNADNPPLKIEKVFTRQQTISMITYLERNKKYLLRFGDSLAVAGDYDLQTFKDSIDRIRPLHYGSIQPIKKNEVRNNSSRQNGWVWPTIIAAAIVLSFFTWKLTRDISQSKN